MFNIGNQVIIKSTNERGFVYQVLTERLLVIGIKGENTVSTKLCSVDDVELMKCEFGGVCSYSCNPSSAIFACTLCRYERGVV